MKRLPLFALALGLTLGASADTEMQIRNGKLTTDLNANNFKIINLQLPVLPGDAATKGYVDSVVTGGGGGGGGGAGLPIMAGQAGKFLSTDGTIALWSAVSWTALTGTPTTILGYGITDPIVLTSGTYDNPSWITHLAWAKITGTPTTLSGYGITTPLPIGAIPTGTTSSTVAIGNDARFPANVVGLRKGVSPGTASLDVAAIPSVDYATFSAGTFDAAGTAIAPRPWTGSATMMNEGANVGGVSWLNTVDGYALLPPASQYAGGTIITYVDTVTVANFGRNWRPQAVSGTEVDKLDGLTNAQMATLNTWLRPFIAGGLNAGQGVYQWKSNGTDSWTSIYSNGRSYKIQDGSDASKQAVFDISAIVHATTRTIFAPDASSATVSETAPVAGQVVKGFSLNSPPIGRAGPYLITDTFSPWELTEVEYAATTTTTPQDVTPPTGLPNRAINAIRIAAVFTTPFQFNLPPVGDFDVNHEIRVFDPVGAINSTRALTLKANGTDTISGSAPGGTYVVTDKFSSLVLTADPTSSSWTVSRSGGGGGTALAGGRQVIETVIDSTHSSLDWTNLVPNAPLQMGWGIVTRDNAQLNIPDAVPGMNFDFFVQQDSVGGHKVFLPFGAYTPANGKGSLVIDSAANAITEIQGHCLGVSGLNWFWSAILNYSVNVVAACVNTAQQETPWTGANFVGIAGGVGSTRVASHFVASSSYTTCAIALPISRNGAPAGDLTVWLEGDSAGRPNNSIIQQSNQISHTDPTLPTTIAGALATPVIVQWNQPVSINSGQTYWVVVAATGAGSNSNDYLWAAQAGQTGFTVNKANSTDSPPIWTDVNANTKASVRLLKQ